jgi:hypothetical protein
MISPEISKYMSKLGKKARRLNPKPKEYYQRLQKLSCEAKKRASNRTLHVKN